MPNGGVRRRILGDSDGQEPLFHRIVIYYLFQKHLNLRFNVVRNNLNLQWLKAISKTFQWVIFKSFVEKRLTKWNVKL